MFDHLNISVYFQRDSTTSKLPRGRAGADDTQAIVRDEFEGATVLGNKTEPTARWEGKQRGSEPLL